VRRRGRAASHTPPPPKRSRTTAQSPCRTLPLRTTTGVSRKPALAPANRPGRACVDAPGTRSHPGVSDSTRRRTNRAGRCSGAGGVRRWNKFVRPVSVRALVDAAHEVDVAHSGAREAEGLEHVEHLRGSRADLLAADGPVEAGVPMRSPVMRSFLPTCQRRKRQWQSQLAATDRYAEPRRQLPRG
jgi:hypothetical protein